MMLPGAWDENSRLRGTASGNLVDAALAGGASRYIQESIALAYPDRGAEWIDESAPLELTSHLSTVADAEAAACRFAERGTGIVLRFSAFYGAESGQTRDTVAAVRRGLAPIPGAPDAYISSIAIEDVASAVVAALAIESGIYNVADDEPLTRQVFHRALAEALCVRPPRSLPSIARAVFGPAGGMLARSQRVSNRKLREASNWRPAYPSAREGWRAVVAALQDQT